MIKHKDFWPTDVVIKCKVQIKGIIDYMPIKTFVISNIPIKTSI